MRNIMNKEKRRQGNLRANKGSIISIEGLLLFGISSLWSRLYDRRTAKLGGAGAFRITSLPFVPWRNDGRDRLG
jgi:hypothetical protein